MLKLLALCTIAILAFALGCSKPTEVKQQPVQTTEQLQAVFNKKVACKREEEKLRENVEQDQLIVEAIYRVFYSPKLDSCVVAEFTLYPQNKKTRHSQQEKAELIDALSQKQLWMKFYPTSETYPEVQSDLDGASKSLSLE